MSHIFLGLGNGQFVLEMGKYAFSDLRFWEYQPIHNVFLLILSELGIVGLFLFIWFLLELFANVPSYKKCSTPAQWNVPRGTMFHVEQFLLGGTSKEMTSKRDNAENSDINHKHEAILKNNYDILSSSLLLIYAKAILFSFIFIMLFDHYFWDIQQGQLMFWIIAGLTAINTEFCMQGWPHLRLVIKNDRNKVAKKGTS